jgi:quercetin dioxygenase-like cupin family protein
VTAGRAGPRASSDAAPPGRHGVAPEELLLGGPLARQRLTVCQPAATTGGRLVVLDVRFPAASRRPPDHYHPHQEEQVELLAGTLRARLDGRARALLPGDVLLVPPGARHAVWNDGPVEARAIRRLHPALATEALLVDLAAALRTGGLVSLWRVAAALRAHRHGVRFDPAALAHALVAAAAHTHG